MFDPLKKLNTNIVSLIIYFFLLFYISSCIKNVFQGQFNALDGWQLLNLLLFLCFSYWAQQVLVPARCIGSYSVYMFSTGCLFAFVLSDEPFLFQTVFLYFVGAFIGGMLWYLIAKNMLRV